MLCTFITPQVFTDYVNILNFLSLLFYFNSIFKFIFLVVSGSLHDRKPDHHSEISAKFLDVKKCTVQIR